ncbi:MAG: hypothetical protein ABIR30_05720 [Chitinophagaceae bacterium]
MYIHLHLNMVDAEFIKDHYATLTEEQLIELVEEGTQDLLPEALTLLKQEFRARGLSMSFFETKEISSGESLPDNSFNPSTIPNSIIGTSDEDVFPSNYHGSKEKLPEVQSREELEHQVGISDREAKKNGLIAVIGIVITFLTYEMAGQGGTYVIAWGAILFGGFGFIKALLKKSKYETALKGKEGKMEEK